MMEPQATQSTTDQSRSQEYQTPELVELGTLEGSTGTPL